MRTNGKHLLAAGAVMAAVTVALGAEPAVAQERPMYELSPITVEALTDADMLHEAALALYEQPARWEEAAELHRAAAESLPKNDAKSFAGFDRAARLFFYAGEFGDARSSMEDAARVALATGDVYTAAHSLVDAAFIAVHEGYAGKRRELTAEARELAASDVLSAEAKDELLARIEAPEDVRLAFTPRTLVVAD